MNQRIGTEAPAVQADAIYLPSRTREWTAAKVLANARSRSDSPGGAAVAVFDVLDDLFQRADREARAFASDLARMSDRGDEVGGALRLAFHEMFLSLAIEARLAGSEDFALACDVLLSGAAVCTMSGDVQSARRARDMARDVLVRHRPSVRAVAQPVNDEFALDFTAYEELSPFEQTPAVRLSATPGVSPRAVAEIDDYLADLDALGRLFA